MMQQILASTPREQRLVAPAPRLRDSLAERQGFGFDMDLTRGTTGTATAANTVWNVKPCVHPSAICTFGKYHTRRLQEMRT